MSTQVFRFLKHASWLVSVLLSLAWIEHQWPMMAIAVFVVMTLSLGFTHGAMDIFLLQDQRDQPVITTYLIYAAAVVLLTIVLIPWPSVALIVLILLSVWHFGEQAHHEHAGQPEAWLLRGVQGGSSVMLPVLLSPDDLMLWVKRIAGTDMSWVWLLWVGTAGLWAALLIIAVVLIKPWRDNARKILWIECAALILLNIFLSPLLAFALFFGLYHSAAHIWRMRRLQRREGKVWQDWLLITTILITLLAFVGLMWWMTDQTFAMSDTGQWMRTLVVALVAVTFPHLILVSRSRHRLFT